MNEILILQQLYEISNKRAVDSSRIYAKRAQLSTDRMERMTDAMFEISKKTQQETVSMKIITLVTLFFLPGTFISVSLVRLLFIEGPA
jgi:Mg2+ and Co2+ transporter CorA